jgi:nitrogenase molybdenum-iron protein beta chain
LPALTEKSIGKTSGLVNIWGIVPQQDVFWQGNLSEIRRVLGKIGVTANTLFGFHGGIDAWQRISGAELNVVVSPWGVEIARILEEKYGTPWLDFKKLPVGADDTSFLLHQVADKLGLDRSVSVDVSGTEEAELNYHLARFADAYFRAGFQKEFALVGETAQVLSLAGFLSGVLGLLPGIVVITDNPPVSLRDEITTEIRKFSVDDLPVISFSSDFGEISDILDTGSPELIIGSNLEAEAAVRLQVPLLQISFPVVNRIVLNRGYAGYRGAVNLIEDLGSVLLSSETI